mmetsp:Transcript_39796/g.55265  ORF Transcript_39796/g.55265 Transcript_39796/m.55265 type:complete len:331 (+) Transcript_39796:135-1127(+)|eukprot:CAMPEP_0196572206 /NCGR_PEP_ID=MMETSP1081-20130531/2288_1 /TAXON_ID=36882 /ORGANISM="Pyramimonas amylifera, Strain CCMP720" /LENGTH=330 /DNA_ID=CAMNT_0041889437 /DNA_START=118 /DNA_END=1113 /DNA_ORIENTATION=+
MVDRERRVRIVEPKPAPWKVDPSARRFSGPGANRQIPKVHKPSKGLIELNGIQSMRPEWETTMAESYGPANSNVLTNERLKKMSALDEAVTRNWTTTQDTIGNAPSNKALNDGKEEARQALNHKRSKVVSNTHGPWSTSYDTLGKNQPNGAEKKKVIVDLKTFFPEKVDYVTTQKDYGAHTHPRGSQSARPPRMAGERHTELKPLDPYMTTTEQYGQHQTNFLNNRKAKTMEMEERAQRRQPTPLSELKHDILGAVDTSNEEEAFYQAYAEDQMKDLSSIAFNTFMYSEAAKGKPFKKESTVPEHLRFPKSTSYKIRKGLRNLNIDPNDL